MQALATSVTCVSGLAALTLIGASVPPSLRPSRTVPLPAPAEAPTPTDSDPSSNSSTDSVLIVSADLGDVWHPPVGGRDEVRTDGSSRDRPVTHVSGTPAPTAAGASRPVPGDAAAIVPTRPVEAAGRSLHGFLSADRALAPPVA